jgi:small subunit ribosomal protein S35
VPKKPKFPREWYMTPERKEELAGMRERAAALDGALVASGRLADGVSSARAHLNATPELTYRVDELLAGKVYKRHPMGLKKR